MHLHFLFFPCNLSNSIYLKVYPVNYFLIIFINVLWYSYFVFKTYLNILLPLIIELDKQGINLILNKHESRSGYAAVIHYH